MTRNKGISLERIQLVNWYTHTNRPISVGNVTAITGPTGSGKSTINDALLYNLTCKTKFNQASDNRITTSGENKKRNIYRYIRAYTGVVGHEYVRGEGSVTGYIFLEWKNNLTGNTFITATAMDSPNPDPTERQKTTRYIFKEETENFCLEDLSFCDEEGNILPESRLKIKGRSPAAYKKENNSRYLEALERVFGHGFRIDDFVSIYDKASAYNSKDDTQNFLSAILFGEKKAHDDAIISDVQKVQEIMDSIEDKKICQQQLAPVCDLIRKYRIAEADAQLHEDIRQYHELQNLKKTIETEQHGIKADTTEIHALTDKQKQEDTALRELDTEIIMLKGQMSDAGGAVIQALEKQIEERRLHLSEYAEQRKDMLKLVSSLEQAKGISGDLDAALSSLLSAVEKQSPDTEMLYRSLYAKMQQQVAKNNETRDANIGDRVLISKELDRYRKEYDGLVKGHTGSEKVASFISRAERFWEERGVKVNLWSIAELVEDVTPEWQKAIEAFVGRRREYIICPPEDYNRVKEFWYRHSNRDVSLICINKIKDRVAEDDSIYKELRVKNPYAAKYLKSIIGNITKCEDVDEIERYERALTKEGITFLGAVLESMDIRNVRLLFGKDAVERRKKELRTSIDKYAKNLKKIQDTIYFMEDANARMLLCMDAKAEGYLGAERRIRECEEAITRIKESIEAAQTDTYIQLSIRVGEKEEERKRLSQQKEETDSRRIAAGASLQKREQTLRSAREKNAIVEAAFLSLPEARQVNCREAYLKNPVFRKRDFEFDEASRTRDNLREKTKDAIQAFLRFDKARYSVMDHGSAPETFDLYLDEYSRLRTENAGELMEKLKETKDKLRYEVCLGTISRLYRNICEAKDLKREINATLGEVAFGRDNYELIVERAKREPFKSLYSVITEVGKASQTGAIIDREKYSDKLETFTNSVIESVVNPEIQKLSDLLDYRSYLNFDIEKYSGKTKTGEKIKRVLMSTKSASESGGEAQTAYYVILAAAFMRIYSTDSIRLYVVDEAFDKMDAPHKQALMRFLKENDLQVIVTSPTIGDFGPTMDTVISVVMLNGVILTDSSKKEIHTYRIAKIRDAG